MITIIGATGQLGGGIVEHLIKGRVGPSHITALVLHIFNVFSALFAENKTSNLRAGSRKHSKEDLSIKQ